MGRENMPHGREKRVTEPTGSVHKRGDGLNLGGPVGNSGGYNRGEGGGPGKRSGRGPGGLLGIIIAIAAALLGGGSMLGGFGGSGGGSASSTMPQQKPPAQVSTVDTGSFSGYNFSSYSNGWKGKSNNQVLNSEVREGSREKRTKILGKGKDKVTVMVYMCGTDLESRSGMATSDISEMAKATLSDKVNVIIYTGGCRAWKNQVISNKTNQIYQVKDGGLIRLVDNVGNKTMTDGATLTEFINFCTKNFPANRQELILWDHGGGSVSGYGYDEKAAGSGGMSLAALNQALKNAGTTFDFIGFDACLMATMENALMLDDYADYLIASEESEPGYGWYYTGWLTELSRDPAMPTVEIGKHIADDFVAFCTQKGQGNITTLSVTDLAELGTFGPEAMKNWAKTATDLIKNEEYKTVSNARANTKEFAASQKIDQVDFGHLALNTGTKEGKELFDVITGAVKYNHVAKNITNAYGLSVFFPYKKASYVNRAVKTYDAIGMDDEYAACIRAFASVETAGQAATGGTGNPMGSLLGGGYSGSSSYGGGSSYSGSDISQELMMQLLQSLLSGSYGGISGLDRSNTGFLDEEIMEEYTEFICENSLTESDLYWQDTKDGPVLTLKAKQWDLVQNLLLNVFYDDGEGFIDLGLDNVYEFTENGSLKGEYDRTWLAINGQPVAYYFVNEEDNGDAYTINGYVPCMLNGQRVELLLVFTDEEPYGTIEGARYIYENGETDTVAKSLEKLKAGDTLEFICDYYTYQGEFVNNYYLGEPMTIEDPEEIMISNVDIGEGKAMATYRFTDIYNKEFWTPAMK